MQRCSLHPAPLDTWRKSPLTPLFKRGGFVRVRQIPPLAKGEQGGFLSRERGNSTRFRFISAALSFLCPLLFAGLCAAHPLGNFSISQYAALRVGGESVAIRYIIDMAEIPTFKEIQDTGIAPNRDDPKTQAYLAKKILALSDGLSLEIGGRRLPLHADSKEIIFPAGAGGLPTLKIGVLYKARLPVSANGLKFSLNYRDGNFVGRAGWKEIIVLPAAGAEIENSSVPASDRSAGLSNYPTDLLNTPPQDLEARVVFSVPVVTAATAGTEKSSSLAGEVITPATSVPSRAKSMNSDETENQHVYVKSVGDGRDRPVLKEATSPETSPALNLDSPGGNSVVRLQVNERSTPRDSFTELMATKQLSWSVILVALAVAVGLGAFHALEPGHGKTLVAAYLVGSRGTMKHALLLGLIVTAAHTAGVYLLGGIALYASRYIVPDRLYPWLEVVSGIMIAVLGTMLFFKRYRGKGSPYSYHHHDHGQHIHPHDHEHEFDHRHGSHTHQHSPAHHEVQHKASQRELLTLGISGGIVPCPAALVVLLSGVSMNRAGFGLILIVAFSSGLAAVLIAIGMLMVYARHFMARFQSEGKWVTHWLPITSSGFIVLLGVALIWQALQTTGLT
jgi:ABC-type nickel/cobalt efflux system permease component RcnA